MLTVEEILKDSQLETKKDWCDLAKQIVLPDAFIRMYEAKFDWAKAWSNLSHFQPLSADIIKEYANKINWHDLALHNNDRCELTEDVMRKVIKYIVKKKSDNNLQYLVQNYHVSEKFLDDFSEYLNLARLNYTQILDGHYLSKDFIRKYADRLCWYDISYQFGKKDEAFVEEFANKVEWSKLQIWKFSKKFIMKHLDKFTDNQKLKIEFLDPEKLIDEGLVNIEKINWCNLCENRKLSENFIRKYADKVNWFAIWKYQNLSEAFIEEFIDHADWKLISENQKLSNAFVLKHAKDVNWASIFSNPNFDLEFLFKNKKFYFDAYAKNIAKMNNVSVEEVIEFFSDKKRFSEIIEGLKHTNGCSCMH